ncbi:TPA: hypothetical protein ACRHJO_RS09805, partial [Neisseria meningitidis]
YQIDIFRRPLIVFVGSRPLACLSSFPRRRESILNGKQCLIKFRNRILPVDSRLRGNDGISVFQ